MGGCWGTRAILGGLGLASLLGYAVGFAQVPGSGARTFVAYVVLFLALFGLYLAAVWVVLRRPSEDRSVLGLILGFGLLFRLVLLTTPVVLSSDVYRYLWDGRVQWAGINPYRYPPAASELAPLRDPTIYPEINRPTKRTVYPPGTQALFAVVFGVAPDSLLAWRLVLLGCEVVTGGLLLDLLRRMGIPRAAVLVYAWAPLVVFEGVQAGHVDVAVVPSILLALRARQAGRMTRAGLALGVAVALKLYPVVLLFAWWRRREWRMPLTCAAVVAAGYLAYLEGVGARVTGFLPEYFSSAEDFNIGLRYFLTGWLPLAGELPRQTVRGVTMLLEAVALGTVLGRFALARTEDAPGVFRAAMAAVTAYLVLLPTALHAWYVVWVVPFLTVRVSPAWLWFTGAVALSYLKYPWEPAEFPFWLRALEFFPLYALLAWEWWTGRMRLVRAPLRPGTPTGGVSTVQRLTERVRL